MVPALKARACMSDLQTLREGCQQLSLLEPLRGVGTVPALSSRVCMTAQKALLKGCGEELSLEGLLLKWLQPV